jgi:hypothetical protein
LTAVAGWLVRDTIGSPARHRGTVSRHTRPKLSVRIHCRSPPPQLMVSYRPFSASVHTKSSAKSAVPAHDLALERPFRTAYERRRCSSPPGAGLRTTARFSRISAVAQKSARVVIKSRSPGHSCSGMSFGPTPAGALRGPLLMTAREGDSSPSAMHDGSPTLRGDHTLENVDHSRAHLRRDPWDRGRG